MIKLCQNLRQFMLRLFGLGIAENRIKSVNLDVECGTRPGQKGVPIPVLELY